MEEKLSEMLAFRVTPSEKARAKKLAKTIKRRLPYATEAMVFRELMGFTNTGLVSPQERASMESQTEDEQLSDNLGKVHSMADLIITTKTSENKTGKK